MRSKTTREPPPQPEVDAPGARASRQVTGSRILTGALDNIVWVLLVLFLLLGGLLNPYFLTIANLQNVLVQATVLGFVGLAVALTLLLANIDLSVIGTLGISAALGAVAMRDLHLLGVVAILLVIAIGGVIGLVNGLCIAKLRMNALIETLAMGLLLQGAVLAVTRGQTITISSGVFNAIGQQSVGGWPLMPLALIVAYVAAAIVLNHTVWGRRIYATGGNEKAAKAAGINADRVRVQVYVAAGLLSGAAGWLATAYLGGINSTVGSDLLLYAVAAPVIGGISLFGGRGRVTGLLGGALLLTVVQVGLQIVNISAYYVNMVGGAMIFLAVIVDAVRIRRQTSS